GEAVPFVVDGDDHRDHSVVSPTGAAGPAVGTGPARQYKTPAIASSAAGHTSRHTGTAHNATARAAAGARSAARAGTRSMVGRASRTPSPPGTGRTKPAT